MSESIPYLRRNNPGTSRDDWCNWQCESFEEMESPLAVQQYIQQSIRRGHRDVAAILEPPHGVDEGVWRYEHLRQFCMELNGLAVRLQDECNPETCTQMTATEQWIFLCAAHKTPKEVVNAPPYGESIYEMFKPRPTQCPAIDYTRHTLDGAACLLNSNRYFPSRVTIKESSVGKLGSVCRRVYRIFSHAFFHHRDIFDAYEVTSETIVASYIKTAIKKPCIILGGLMSEDNLIVPMSEDGVTRDPPSSANVSAGPVLNAMTTLDPGNTTMASTA